MNNLFADIGSPQHYFKPVWYPNNQLMGVEIMTRLADKDSPESLTHRVQMARLDEKQQIALFNEKITLIEKVKNLLLSREITVWVNINDVILTEMMQDPQWVTRLQNLPFLTLMIKEEFPGMNFGRNNLRLIWLTERFSLALANLGSGKSSNRAVFDGLFQHIFLEQRFVHNRSQRLSFIPFTNAIIRQIAPFCDALIVSGIDDMALYNEVKRLGFTAMRGSLWPAIAPDNLSSLLNAAKNPAL